MVNEDRANPALVLAQVQQETGCVLFTIGLPADAHVDPLRVLGLPEEVQY
eukprot:CAMPEP_0175466890 /NCGR_PEP_ID=MMETSP0095-20121207/71040_1 /TAXON_ID=311494 /ORGANISM="Alexandrium monilatum, Strain CCMP3105" /LENGTH=49 /DNA_ID= /DNA_START= /DNA_END= /DNA_ORIENTATION=